MIPPYFVCITFAAICPTLSSSHLKAPEMREANSPHRFPPFTVFAVFEKTVSCVKSKRFVSAVFAVFAVFAFSRGLPPHHRGHTFRMYFPPRVPHTAGRSVPVRSCCDFATSRQSCENVTSPAGPAKSWQANTHTRGAAGCEAEAARPRQRPGRFQT